MESSFLTYYFLDRSLGPMVGVVAGLGTWLALVGTAGPGRTASKKPTCNKPGRETGAGGVLQDEKRLL